MVSKCVLEVSNGGVGNDCSDVIIEGSKVGGVDGYQDGVLDGSADSWAMVG